MYREMCKTLRRPVLDCTVHPRHWRRNHLPPSIAQILTPRSSRERRVQMGRDRITATATERLLVMAKLLKLSRIMISEGPPNRKTPLSRANVK